MGNDADHAVTHAHGLQHLHRVPYGIVVQGTEALIHKNGLDTDAVSLGLHDGVQADGQRQGDEELFPAGKGFDAALAAGPGIENVQLKTRLSPGTAGSIGAAELIPAAVYLFQQLIGLPDHGIEHGSQHIAVQVDAAAVIQLADEIRPAGPVPLFFLQLCQFLFQRRLQGFQLVREIRRLGEGGEGAVPRLLGGFQLFRERVHIRSGLAGGCFRLLLQLRFRVGQGGAVLLRFPAKRLQRVGVRQGGGEAFFRFKAAGVQPRSPLLLRGFQRSPVLFRQLRGGVRLSLCQIHGLRAFIQRFFQGDFLLLKGLDGFCKAADLMLQRGGIGNPFDQVLFVGAEQLLNAVLTGLRFCQDLAGGAEAVLRLPVVLRGGGVLLPRVFLRFAGSVHLRVGNMLRRDVGRARMRCTAAHGAGLSLHQLLSKPSRGAGDVTGPESL